MMLKLILKIVTFSIMFGSVVILFLITLGAMLTTGTIRLEFNVFNEGWAEVVVWGLAIIPSFIFSKEYLKNSAKEYALKKRINKMVKYRFRTNDVGMAGRIKDSPPVSCPATIITHLNGGWD